MSEFSRRTFLEQASAVSFCALTGMANANPADRPSFKESSNSILPVSFPGQWSAIGRLIYKESGNGVILQDGFAVTSESWEDGEFRFRARAPKGTEEVQIWAGVRCFNRDRRYIFALRGGNNNDVYLARYAPDGGIEFLGIGPLDFHPVPETWYSLRAVVRKNRFQIYVNDQSLPRVNVVDDGALWSKGSVSLGGGWLPAEFRDVHTHILTQTEAIAVDAIGNRVWGQQPGASHRERLRAQQRAEYRAANVIALEHPRVEISLDGKWLFLPDQEQYVGATPHAPDCDDMKWHVMDVPDFWTPTVTWLYGETGFPHLNNVAAMKGVSDKFYIEEIERLDGYTFDWRSTRSAWYRHYIDLPFDIAGRCFELCFDAIAMLSEIWVNGVKVAAHTGMFGEVRQDVTSAMRPGRNVIAVHAIGQINDSKAPEAVVGVAVTVEVTASMLNSLPHGMYHDVGGIWQPVRLIVTGPIKVTDVYITPHLEGLDCDVTVSHDTSGLQETVLISFAIRSVRDQALFYSSQDKPERIEALNSAQRFSIAGLAPEPWSPQEPNLYDLEITLTSAGETLDRHITRFGFRTFAAEQGQLLLNGRPFWLRGADHFPHSLRPNDGILARSFMRLAKEGNVVATRTHTAPFSRTWLDAADEAGMMVSFEGTWPWLMLRGAPPSEELLRAWQDEFISLIHQYRNHPSIVIWTVNNEMKFASADRNDPKLLRQKWQILTNAIKAMRKTDPTRPVVCDSSYCRKSVEHEYDTLIRPDGFDDGDIDDAHVYPGWYNPSFFHYFHGEFGKTRRYEGRPLISQEMSTGYPRNDDGHPTRFYLFKHYTPQALVGDEAYENRNPAIFLKRQALMTKELAEAIRRTNRSDCSGILHFAYLTWFKDVWSADSIRPFETYHALRLALQPVLVSAELYGRHFYAGSQVRIRACIVNDAENGSVLPRGELSWEIRLGEQVIATAVTDAPSVPYYSNQWIDLSISFPTMLPSPRVDATLRLSLRVNGILCSENSYDIVIATHDWSSGASSPRVVVFGSWNEVTLPLRKNSFRSRASLGDLQKGDIAIVGDAEETLRIPENISLLRQFLNDGGRVLLLHAGEQLVTLFPDQIKSVQSRTCEIAAMRIPESLAFDGLEPLDLAWWELGKGAIPQVCRGFYHIDSSRSDVRALADAVDFHGYLQTPQDVVKMGGSPLVEVRVGKGRALASELMLLEASPSDPLATRLFSNLIRMLCTDSESVT